MHDLPHPLLLDLLAAQDSAAGHGCGLDPRLCELLADSHGAWRGTPARPGAPRHGGAATTGAADARR